MKTITALYDTHVDANLAVKALEDAGVPSDHISIVSYKDGKKEVEGQGNDAAEGAGTGAGIGAVVGGTGGLLTGLGMLAIPGVGPVVARGGWPHWPPARLRVPSSGAPLAVSSVP